MAEHGALVNQGGLGARGAGAPREGLEDFWLAYGGNPNVPITKPAKKGLKAGRNAVVPTVDGYNKKLAEHYDELRRLKNVIKGGPQGRALDAVLHEYNKITEDVKRMRAEVKKAGGTPLPMPKKLNGTPKKH